MFDPKAVGSRAGFIDGTKEELDLERANEEHRRELEATGARPPWWRRWFHRKPERRDRTRVGLRP